jgi:hypothetical protein
VDSIVEFALRQLRRAATRAVVAWRASAEWLSLCPGLPPLPDIYSRTRAIGRPWGSMFASFDRVRVTWLETAHFYDGVVRRVHEDYTVDVAFDEWDTEALRLHPACMAKIAVDIGSHDRSDASRWVSDASRWAVRTAVRHATNHILIVCVSVHYRLTAWPSRQNTYPNYNCESSLYTYMQTVS